MEHTTGPTDAEIMYNTSAKHPDPIGFAKHLIATHS